MTPRELAAAKRAALAARARRIRLTVAAAAVSAFLALFGGVYAQMATGRDPVIGSGSSTAASSSTSRGSSAASQTSTRSSATSGDTQSSNQSSSGSTAMTTSQS